MRTPSLVLDFDGVIADALEECALVTWLGAHPPARERAISSYLPVMPAGFRQRFRLVRDYSRILAHFVVAHRPVAAHITTRTRFETVFGAISADYVRGFSALATSARTRCRTEEPQRWLGLHTLYPGVADVLRAHSGAIAVVTAKDEASVRAILEHHGLGQTVGQVFGECSRKPDAVRELAARHGIGTDRLTFVDDNLGNVLQVAQTGARGLWAMWGYSTPEDHLRARNERVERLGLADLGRLTG